MKKQGFTLIEMLIALALFGLLSLLAWRGLDTILASRVSVQAPAEAALALQAAWTQVAADLQAARTLRANAPAAPTGLPYIKVSTHSLTLLRNPAGCTGCWEGVHYDTRSGKHLIRKTTGAHPTMDGALAALNALENNAITGGLGHIVLTDVEDMRIEIWRDSTAGTGWSMAGTQPETLAKLAAAAPVLSGATPVSQQALKIEWRLGAPWAGWMSRVFLVDNRW